MTGREADYDVVVVGGGPSGLAAAINGASEGLRVLLVDSKDQLGGQASASAAIENYPGFPEAVTGRELMTLFISQAQKFHTEFLRPVVVTGMMADGELRVVFTDDDQRERVLARAVILAPGLSYRRLAAKGVADFLGRGVSYGMPVVDSRKEGQCFCVVGGANSAGQAAVYLSQIPGATVEMLVRHELATTMSQYLIDRIRGSANIEVLSGTEVDEARGDTHLRSIVVKTKAGAQAIDTDGLYIFIGAAPKTMWLNGLIERDARGYILTGRRLTTWSLERQPLAFETSMPGVFACGDVREGSTKRIASAVGEGSVAIQQVHGYLSQLH